MQPIFSSRLSNQSLLELDYQATTPCSPEVVAAMAPFWDDFWGNPSSKQNRSGLKAAAAMNVARDSLASLLKVAPERLVFTSGATEANNLALIGHARARAIELGKPGHIITLATEHHSVLDPLRELQREGFQVNELCPDSDGRLSKKQLASAFRKDTFLVSVMLANNEIGVVQPIEELARECRERGVAFHSDAAQAFGYLPLLPDELGIDLMSLSGHKIYGPKGIGALILRSDLSIKPLMWGGGQENGLRPGTIPVPLVVGLAKAAEIAVRDLSFNHQKFFALRNELWKALKGKIPDLILNGSYEHRLAHNLNFSIPGVSGGRLHRELRTFLACSSGSACSNGAPSHVLMALGRSACEAEASVRLSVGLNTTNEEIREAVKVIEQTICRLRK